MPQSQQLMISNLLHEADFAGSFFRAIATGVQNAGGSIEDLNATLSSQQTLKAIARIIKLSSEKSSFRLGDLEHLFNVSDVSFVEDALKKEFFQWSEVLFDSKGVWVDYLSREEKRKKSTKRIAVCQRAENGFLDIATSVNYMRSLGYREATYNELFSLHREKPELIKTKSLLATGSRLLVDEQRYCLHMHGWHKAPRILALPLEALRGPIDIVFVRHVPRGFKKD